MRDGLRWFMSLIFMNADWFWGKGAGAFTIKNFFIIYLRFIQTFWKIL